ncbi:aspartate/glutamate racemase family protein [Clostridium rectalis]|uniref:aspartate/glutamate racemase family protein n=1 Tax=Clostridium rectalis TaxID=2040295 RepID=UPI000F641A56|nr:amino acid racemase [Clostridium rectalis]
MAKVVGILGGMGPKATVDIFNKIIDFTYAKSDQDNIRILIDNNTKIPDRTAFILGEGENPISELMETAIRLRNLGSEILIMPCNTAHYFYDQLAEAVKVPFINMIDEVGKYIFKFYGNCTVGLLATEGTYRAKVYDKYLNKYGIKIILPNDEDKLCVSNLIYKVKSGDRDFKIDEVLGILNKFLLKDVNVIILGCTELPILFDKFSLDELKKFNLISSTEILAKKTVELAK